MQPPPLVFRPFIFAMAAFAGLAAAIPEYTVPAAQLRVLHPRGFEVHIPAGENITLFAFHGKRNAEMNGREAGDWARDVVRVQDGLYTFRDCEAKLQNGDVINFWTYVIWNGLGYHQDDGQFTVTGIGEGVEVESSKCSAKHPSDYKPPPAMLKVLRPQGFEVSIPAEDDITLFAFHGQLNTEFEGGREIGTWAGDITRIRNGRFTYRDQRTVLKPGDILYFWTVVVWKALAYIEEGSFLIDAENSNNQWPPLSAEPDLSGASDSTGRTPNSASMQDTFGSMTSASTSRSPVPSASCTESVTRITGQDAAPCVGQLIFEDTFEQLDADRWRIEQRFSTQPDHEFGVYVDSPETVSVANGILSVGVSLLPADFRAETMHFGTNCTGRPGTDECDAAASHSIVRTTPPIGLGQLSTAHSFRFQYGRIVIRALLPFADWTYPQLWLQPSDTAYGTEDYASGQMRVAFATAGWPSLAGGVLLAARSPFRELDMCRATGDREEVLDERELRRLNDALWRDEYHEYSLDWRPEGISVAIDNHTYCRIQPDFAGRLVNGRSPEAASVWRQLGTGPMAPFDRPFYVQLGIAVGGIHDFSDQPDREYPGRPKPWNNADEAGRVQEFWTAVSQRDRVGADDEQAAAEDSVIQWDLGLGVEEPETGRMPRDAEIEKRGPWPGDQAKLQVDYVRVYAV